MALVAAGLVLLCARSPAWSQSAPETPLALGTPIDLDSGACHSGRDGLLYTFGFVDGEYADETSAARALWFRPTPSADPVSPYSGALAEWAQADTILLTPPTRLLSSVLPHAGLPGAFGLAGPEPDGRFGLVHLEPRSLAATPRWLTAGRPLLLGRVGDAAVVVVRDETLSARGQVRVVSLAEGDGVERAAVEVPAAATLAALPVGDLSLPNVVPLGPTTFALRCDGGQVCVIDVQPTDISVEVIALPATDLGLFYEEVAEETGELAPDDAELDASVDGEPMETPEGLPMALLPGDLCLPLNGPPADWPTAERVPCPNTFDTYPYGGLPVDGTWVEGAPVAVDACLVRDRIALPELLDPTMMSPKAAEWLRTSGSLPPGVFVMGPETLRFGALELDLLITSAQSLAVGYSSLREEVGVATHREWGLAMPPGTVQAWPVQVGGLPAYVVRIRANFPFAEDFYHNCRQGWLVIEVATSGQEHAVANVYREIGFCE